MKNFKKLNRNEMKTISAGNGGGDIAGIISKLFPGKELEGGTLCKVQCLLNGVVSINILPCGSTC